MDRWVRECVDNRRYNFRDKSVCDKGKESRGNKGGRGKSNARTGHMDQGTRMVRIKRKPWGRESERQRWDSKLLQFSIQTGDIQILWRDVLGNRKGTYTRRNNGIDQRQRNTKNNRRTHGARQASELQATVPRMY